MPSPAQRTRSAISAPSQWLRLLFGLAIVFGLFQWLATALGSDRGQAGVVVAVAVVAAILVVEGVLFGQRPDSALRSLGLGIPRRRGLTAAVLVCLSMWLAVIVFVRATGATLTMASDTVWLLPGLFAQAGIAEETLFRGYLFGRIREGRSFWPAAGLSMAPFVAVHLFMFVTLPWPIALASVLLAAVLSFPMAHLFELGGRTIWAPALLHTVVQGTPKVIAVTNNDELAFALFWIGLSAVLPLLVLSVPRRDSVSPIGTVHVSREGLGGR